MSGESIKIPYRDRDDPLPAVADATRALPEGDDRAVARQIVLRGMTSGMATAGDLLDRLDAMSPSERGGLLDSARQRAGLPSLAEVQREAARRTYAPRIGGGLERDEAGLAIQACGQPGCRNYPVNTSGLTMPVAARKWWCDAHRHLAAPGDMDAWTPGLRFAAGGGLEFAEDVALEAERQRVEAERYAHEREQRRAQRLAQLPEIEAERAAREATLRRAVLPGAP